MFGKVRPIRVTHEWRRFRGRRVRHLVQVEIYAEGRVDAAGRILSSGVSFTHGKGECGTVGTLVEGDKGEGYNCRACEESPAAKQGAVSSGA